MAIAARELEGAGGDEAAELARIEALLPECRGLPLREAQRLLAAAVRGHRFDDAHAQQALDEHLRLTTEARLAVSSPTRK
jgi:hypothetical protein